MDIPPASGEFLFPLLSTRAWVALPSPKQNLPQMQLESVSSPAYSLVPESPHYPLRHLTLWTSHVNFALTGGRGTVQMGDEIQMFHQRALVCSGELWCCRKPLEKEGGKRGRKVYTEFGFH